MTAVSRAPFAYRSSPTKRRRSRALIDTIKSAIVDLLEAEQPMTVRQMFYRLVSAGAIGKTEAEYKQTVCRLLADMRRDNTIPYRWIADNTRWMRKPSSFDSAEDALRATARLYRRNVWLDLPDYIEVWCEKDALAGVLYDVTAEYDVPLMVTRGYPSLSYLHEAAEVIAGQIVRRSKRVTVYYFGDRDPSGVDISRNVSEQLTWFALKITGLPPETVGRFLAFDRIAVEPWQIAAYHLPTRPTKQTDSRARNFAGESVELDAIPPNDLRQLVRSRIEDHLPEGALDAVRVAEESERAVLTRIAETMGRTS
ncbi:MAG TPA: hypothetical protein VIM30_16335 [Candidatus Limnocylindrales bacterium]|jgi:hypothetical protein